jgi:predicted phosphodiesterase
MTKKSSAHDVIQAIKNLASKIGRAPNRDEFRAGSGISDCAMRAAFGGSYSAALHAAGFVKESFNKAGPKKPRDFKYKKSQLDSLTVHEYGLEDLFERAGNPQSLKIAVMPDTHIPYQDKTALRIFQEFIKFYKPHVHIILGDFLDCEPLSSWDAKDFKPRRLVPEALEARKVLEKMCADTPGVIARYYLEGNHEDWINQALVAKIPELADGLEQLGIDLSLKSLLDLDKYGYTLLPVNHFLKLGKIYFTHGLYTTKNHPQKMIDVLKASVVYGHLHDILEANQTSLSGRVEAKSSGCLCLLNAKFMKNKPSNWAHAFTLVELFPNGDFTRVTPTIMDGKLSFGGRVWK